MFKAYKELEILKNFKHMRINMEKLMSFQEVTRLSYIERDLSADSDVQGAKNLTIDATQLRRITDQLK